MNNTWKTVVIVALALAVIALGVVIITRANSTPKVVENPPSNVGGTTNIGSIGLFDLSTNQDYRLVLNGGIQKMIASSTPCSFYTGTKNFLVDSIHIQYTPTEATSTLIHIATSTTSYNATTTKLFTFGTEGVSSNGIDAMIIATTTSNGMSESKWMIAKSTYINIGIQGPNPANVSNNVGYCAINGRVMDN